MFRNLLTVALALFLAVGTVFAEEVKALFVKIDGDKLTVKIDDKEKVMTVAKDAMAKGKDGKEYPLVKSFGKAKEGDKYTLKIEKDEVVSAMKEGKKK